MGGGGGHKHYQEYYIGGKACWEKRTTSRSDDLSKHLKAQCPLSISIVISDGVADVNHVPVIKYY